MQISSIRFRWSFVLLLAIAVVSVLACSKLGSVPGSVQTNAPHNAVIFVADGLRFESVTAEEMPTVSEIRQQGVNFVNSHSLFPTFTTANASAIATGHYLGDTGDFSNTIHVGFRVKSANRSPVPFLENDVVLGEINQHHKANYLSEESLLAVARKAGLSTAAVGKVGPVLIQDITQNQGTTIIVDDATGSKTGIPLSSEITDLLKQNQLPLATPKRGENGKPGSSTQPGAKVANTVQQQYFIIARKTPVPRAW